MGRYPPKEGKNRRKVHFFLSIHKIWNTDIAKQSHFLNPSFGSQIGDERFLAYTRKRARLPTAILFFCCHKCHTRDRSEKRSWQKYRKRREEKHRFFNCQSRILKTSTPQLLKHIQKKAIKHCFTTTCTDNCDTCDSKKDKTPVSARVRVRAREGYYRYFHT